MSIPTSTSRKSSHTRPIEKMCGLPLIQSNVCPSLQRAINDDICNLRHRSKYVVVNAWQLTEAKSQAWTIAALCGTRAVTHDSVFLAAPTSGFKWECPTTVAMDWDLLQCLPNASFPYRYDFGCAKALCVARWVEVCARSMNFSIRYC